MMWNGWIRITSRKYELNGPMGLNFVAMANEIEDLFGIKVDVVPKCSIKSAYLPSVEKDIFYV